MAIIEHFCENGYRFPVALALIQQPKCHSPTPQERPISPSQRKHFSTTHLKSNVTQSNAGIAGPQPPQREAVRSLKTDRSWNPTQLEGSKFGFTPNVSEKSPPRVTIIAPDKVTGGDKAPWLVECHPEYDSRELWNMGVGRSKKLFDGQGFKEGSHWPEHKREEVCVFVCGPGSEKRTGGGRKGERG